MAAFFRLICALGLWAVSAAAIASFPPSTQWSTQNYVNEIGYFPSKQAACTASRSHYLSMSPGRTTVLIAQDGSACQFEVRNSATNGLITTLSMSYVSLPGMCIQNSELVNGVCVCKAGFVQTDGAEGPQCAPEPTSAEKWKDWCRGVGGKDIGFWEAKGRGATGGCYSGIGLAHNDEVPTPGYSTGDVPSDGGCTVGLTNTRSFPDVDGTYYTQGDAVFTGGICREGEVQPTDPEGTEEGEKVKRSDCIGGYQGEMQGMTFCAKPDPTSGVDWNGTSKTTGADGTEVTKETKTTCVGDTCKTETKTTTKDSSGTTTGTNTTTVTENKGTLCAREPGNGACPSSGTGTGTKGNGSGGGGGGGGGDGGESSFGGNCESGFIAISDDAVTNAMAKEQHSRNCKFFDNIPEDTDDTTDAADMRAKGKEGRDQTQDLPEHLRKAVEISGSDFDTSSVIGAQACFTDKTVADFGRTIVIPLSIVCPWLDIIGNLLMVVGWILAARIVIRG